MSGSIDLQSNGHADLPQITLYTNHACPYAHRAHIALQELGLPFDEVIIDLDSPREPWYLKVNPRGLVPSIKYSNGYLKDEIITESQVVAQFLADSRQSHLAPPPSSSPRAPLFRARMGFFMDTWDKKVASYMFNVVRMDTMAEKEDKCKEWAKIVEKEIEPLLADADPFFGGSKDLTLVEVHTAPFILRIYAMCNGELLPKSLEVDLDSLPNFGKWAKATRAKDSVTCIWDEQAIVKQTTKRIEKMRAQAKTRCPFA